VYGVEGIALQAVAIEVERVPFCVNRFGCSLLS
jgi:hypothetical protein